MAFDEIPFTELLSAIVDNRGRTCPTAESGMPLIATNCVRNDLLYPAFENVRYVSPETYKTWFRGHPEPGDLIFVCKGSPGRVCVTPDPVSFCIAQDMVAVRADPNRVYPKYLFAALRSPLVQSRIEGMHVGTLIPHFKKGDFDKLSIPVPGEETQRLIGDTYFAFAAKVDVNHRTNRVLESMARAIYKAWFIDFEPVKAKAAGADCFPGMPYEVFDELPATLIDSELGKIPDGWEVLPIGDLSNVVGGGTPSTKNSEFWDGGDQPFCTPKEMSRLKAPVILGTERMITQAGIERISSGQLPVGTVVLSSRAPIGYLAIAATPLSINQGIIAMMPGEVPSSYVLLWTEANMDVIKARASGSTFAEISKRNFRPIPALRPANDVLEAFDALVKPLYETIELNTRESQALSETRESLLPELLAGNLTLCQ